jgi:hypothetical protein
MLLKNNFGQNLRVKNIWKVVFDSLLEIKIVFRKSVGEMRCNKEKVLEEIVSS